MTTNDALSVVTRDHDKIAHFLAFMIESWLFVMMLDSHIITLPNPLQFWRRLDFDEEMELDGSTGSYAGSDIFDDSRYVKANKYLVALVLCSGVAGLGSEVLQSVLSLGRRSFDLFDVVFDFLGSVLGLMIGYFHERHLHGHTVIPMSFSNVI